jgi:hypothetical protein
VAIAAASSSSPRGRGCLPFRHGGGARLVVVLVLVLIYEKFLKNKAGAWCACYCLE